MASLPAEQVAILRSLPMEQAILFWDGFEAMAAKRNAKVAAVRELCQIDLFYLLVRACKRVDMLHPWIYARVREVEANPYGHLDLWAREHYKDLADDTPMLTANRGWITHGELVAGDRVFSPSGTPVSVLWVTPQYFDSECYRLTFHDHSTIVAGAGHLWRVRQKIKRRIANSELRRVEFVDRIISTKDMLIGGRIDIGSVDALEFPVQQLPIHPYVLGAWLGDGARSSGRLTGIDEEIFARVESLGYKLSKQKNCITRTIYGIRPILRELGILNDKHIPPSYLISSKQQRTELLRGLMDTDGHCDKRGTATFCNAKKIIAEQVFELAAGLGLRPHIRKHSFKSELPQSVNGRYWFWQVSFQASQDRNPFFLPRKAERAIPISHYRGVRALIKIERIESVPTRCIQVDGGMYVAGRELLPTHNSTIITFGLTIQDILKDPNVTIGIFSHTRPIAKAFLRQIMRELEGNAVLHVAFPDVLWGKDVRQAPKWSEDDGIIVKRSSNPNEATIEAWGLVDGQPTSKHFRRLHYDDIVVQASVTTPEMIEKTMTALEQSYNLGTMEGSKSFAGTRWHFNDAYRTVTDRGTVKVRTYPGTDDGTEHGNPVLVTRKRLSELRRDMGPHTFAAQILLNPKADALLGFKREWLKFYKSIDKQQWRKMSRYILVDPASSKKKGSDYTCMGVLGLGTDGNYYLLDGIRDRLNLTERTDRLFKMHRDWEISFPVRYERYSMQADIEHIHSEMELQNYRFSIIEVGTQTKKEDRVGRLIPTFEQGKFYLPRHLWLTDYQKVVRDLVRDFIEEEFVAFPVGTHDDFLDMLSRIAEPDLRLVWPKEEKYIPPPERRDYPNASVGWMGV